MSPTFHALRHYPAYRMFWFGMLVSNVGTWMQRVAQDWLVLVTLGGGPAALGITTGLQFLPFLLLARSAGRLRTACRNTACSSSPTGSWVWWR